MNPKIKGSGGMPEPGGYGGKSVRLCKCAGACDKYLHRIPSSADCPPFKSGGRSCCERRKGTPSLAGRPLFAKSSTGAFGKFTPCRAPDDGDFAACGRRPEGVALWTPTSFLKKARPKTFLLARLRFQWKQAGYYFPIALRRSPKGEGALRYTAPERGQEIPDHSTPMCASAQCGHAPGTRKVPGQYALH